MKYYQLREKYEFIILGQCLVSLVATDQFHKAMDQEPHLEICTIRCCQTTADVHQNLIHHQMVVKSFQHQLSTASFMGLKRILVKMKTLCNKMVRITGLIKRKENSVLTLSRSMWFHLARNGT